MSALSILICFGIPLAVFGGVLVHERWTAFCERIDQALGYGTDGDWPALPDDLKTSFHSQPITDERR